MSATQNLHTSKKQFRYFSSAEELKSCTDDVIPILIRPDAYFINNLNFVACFLNNSPLKKQYLILHWGSKRIPNEAFRQDVFEITTTYVTHSGDEHEEHYFIPAPILFAIFNITIPHGCLLRNEEQPIDSSLNAKDLAIARAEVYNTLICEYCKEHGISHHPLDKLKRKNNAYITTMREH